MRISEHFILEEFTRSQVAARFGIDNTPSPEIITNLIYNASQMELVRNLFGLPIHVSSGYRCKKLNQKIGGSNTSDHMEGLATDFTIPAFGSPYSVALKIAGSDIPFDQLIYEYDWVHIGFRRAGQRRQILTKKRNNSLYLKGIIL